MFMLQFARINVDVIVGIAWCNVGALELKLLGLRRCCSKSDEDGSDKEDQSHESNLRHDSSNSLGRIGISGNLTIKHAD